jgi:hypothetical protein
MIYFPASYSRKGQFKIQQMAFVLVAVFIFFSMVLLIFLSVRLEDIRGGAQDLRNDEAKEIVRKISATPEFAFTQEDCGSCIDLDKVMALKNRTSYKGFWNLDYLMVERVYPIGEGECSKFSYPSCRTLTIINSERIGTPSSAFVSLCRWEQEKEGYFKCELGKVYASGEFIDGN